VYLGEGLGTISKKLHERMRRWEFVDLEELKPKYGGEVPLAVEEPEKLVVLLGFGLAQSKRKPVLPILTWWQCFGRYLTAMSRSFPESTPCMVSHMLVVAKAYLEVKEPG